jgi:diadenylate cyclase
MLDSKIAGTIIESISAHLKSLTFSDYFLTFIDILIVSILIYYAFVLIKGTRATKIIYGIIFLAGILVLGRILKLQTLNWVLTHLTTLVIVAIPVVFQPELRRGLEKLGRIKFFGGTSGIEKKLTGRVINEVLRAVKVLKKNKVGAILAIQRKTGLDDYIETGTEINAKLSSKLLLTIFYPNSPLHDGATIIRGNQVVAAGCILPLSESGDVYTYGTRHRAALGLSENTDAVSIVISEERGVVSLAYDGKIEEDLSIEQLEEKLSKFFK